MSLIKRNLSGICLAAATLACFLFFFFRYPNHLFHKEQMLLFMYAPAFLETYLQKPAGISLLIGDFLTQFYYFRAGGPLILSVLLMLTGLASYRILRKWLPPMIALIAIPVIMCWEAGRNCILIYPLASTVSLLVGMSLFLLWQKIRVRTLRLVLSALFLAIAWFGFGYAAWVCLLLMIIHELYKKEWAGAALLCMAFFILPAQSIPATTFWGRPSFDREHIFALDKALLDNDKTALNALLETDYQMNWNSFFHNLHRATENRLPDELMQFYQPASQALILSVGPESSYLSILFANEFWFRAGDMTMAEHCAMLSMIFSPDHAGTRNLRRLAEINLINDDSAAALKYLRMLDKTAFHKNWARRQMALLEQQESDPAQMQIRKRIPDSDYLRKSGDVTGSLRHLLQCNPDNPIAYQYLLSYALLNKDLTNFFADYRPDYMPGRVFAEAALIVLAQQQQLTPENLRKYQIPPYLVQQFMQYNEMYNRDPEDIEALQADFCNSYWIYYHFAVLPS